MVVIQSDHTMKYKSGRVRLFKTAVTHNLFIVYTSCFLRQLDPNGTSYICILTGVNAVSILALAGIKTVGERVFTRYPRVGVSALKLI